MDLFDTLTFVEILGWTTFLGTLSLTVLYSQGRCVLHLGGIQLEFMTFALEWLVDDEKQTCELK
jgi:hypothetical protein